MSSDTPGSLCSSTSAFDPRLINARDGRTQDLLTLAQQIYDDPELSGDEHRASARCREILLASGFTVENVGDMPTAFVARLNGRKAGPCVGFLAEYDALPTLGHACGHHLIAGSAVGAGLLIASLEDQLQGSVEVIGCPAEETLTGKVAMLEAGAFERIDYALTFHAHDRTSVMTSSNGLRKYRFSFVGRPAHAGNDPWAGVSALDGVLLTYQNLNALRQFVRDGVRIHGIVSHGGDVYNIVPETATCEIAVRSVDPSELRRVALRVLDCARAAAMASATELTIDLLVDIPPVRLDHDLAAKVKRSLEALGRTVENWDAHATTDFANVSQRVPAVLFSVETWPHGTAFHSHEAVAHGFRQAAFTAMLDGALVMSQVGAELLGVR